MVTLGVVIQLDHLRKELLGQALKAVIDVSLIARDLPGNVPDPLLQAVNGSQLILLTDFVSTIIRSNQNYKLRSVHSQSFHVEIGSSTDDTW